MKRKAGEAAKSGATAICANGFWSRAERDELRKFYADMGVACELHYIDTLEEQRIKNILKRNEDIRNGELGYIFTEEKDLYHFFETPGDDEITVRVKFD